MVTPSLVPVTDLPAEYQSVFSNFSHFNKVQSSVFDKIYNSDDTLVINAPTGSGKTVLLELAIVREIKKLKQKSPYFSSSNGSTELHIIYFCPLKSIVSEKLKEWSHKFASFNIVCKDMTGDTPLVSDYGNFATNILLVTPEKFDYNIRTNRPFRKFISLVQLVLIDEIHTLADKNRGDVLEATITRMKMLRKNGGSSNPLRFVGISATAPNVNDIALWLDSDNGVGINIDPDLRPVKLEKIVLGYELGRINENSDYRFDIMLSYYVESLIRNHANGKPSLIFCSTRKSVEFTAKILASAKYSFFLDFDHRARFEMECTNFARQWMTNADKKMPNCDYFTDLQLRETLKSGVAFHHQGLPLMDRRFVEKLYSESLIPVMVCTSSLAMGVNLPAHLVIIKNTVYYNAGVSEEYETSQILQMIGRAGRPQFDTQATAIIMTKTEKKPLYENLLASNSLIESNLHFTLDVQLTVEIVLKTVNSIDEAMKWVESSFLFRRIVSNPEHYNSKITQNDYESARPVIRKWCEETIKKLEEIGLVTTTKTNKFESTKLAKIVIKNSLTIKSFEKLMEMIRKPLKIEALLFELSNFDELLQDVVIRNAEKAHLNELNKVIPYPIDSKIKSSPMKINCLLQSIFSSLTLDQCLIRDGNSLQRSSVRVVKCLLDIIEHLCSIDSFKSSRKTPFRIEISAETFVAAALLLKCIKAKLWFNSKLLTKQLKNIGPVMAKKLNDRGFDSFEAIRNGNGRDIEFCVGRKPPFGSLVIEEVKQFPKYGIEIKKLNFDLDLKDISYEDAQHVSLDIKLVLSPHNKNPGLKPDEHRISLIIMCESCDEIIMINRMCDAHLAQATFHQDIFIVRTHINSTQTESDHAENNSDGLEDDFSMKETLNQPLKRKIGPQILTNAVQKEKLASFSHYFNDFSKKNPSQLFHCCYENILFHDIKVKVISESFVGIDSENMFTVQFRSILRLKRPRLN